MPRVNRSEVCDPDQVQVFHLMNRCVRHNYLCGTNSSGRDYSYRKLWIRDRLEELARLFGLDVFGFSVMDNHLHVIVRTRPDLVRNWSDKEVARRWLLLFPGCRNPQDHSEEPTDSELDQLCQDVEGLAERRRRLCSISWFMRCVAEPIARRGNQEDEVTGRFWEGRFRAELLPDEAAILACMVYVDLNPIRAGVAATPEDSKYTSVFERIADRQAALAAIEDRDPGQMPAAAAVTTSADQPPSATGALEDAAADKFDCGCEHGERAGWLAPIELEPVRTTVREQHTTRRASNRGCVGLTLDDYLRLLDWTGRELRPDKTGRIPAECDPILERLNCSGPEWIDTVQNFRKSLHQLARLRKTDAPPPPGFARPSPAATRA